MNEQPTNEYREGLPPIPARLRYLPVERGFPVPWFVAKVDGKFDFRISDAGKWKRAVDLHLCWICGEKLGRNLAFTIGPMCALNRTISEPPAHRECAEFSIKACPFLNQTEARRRTNDLPEEVREPAGIGLKRQPGAVCLWMTDSYKLFKAPGGSGYLFHIGPPEEAQWYAEGRLATRAEVLASIDSGLPLLREIDSSPAATAELDLRYAEVLKLLPAE